MKTYPAPVQKEGACLTDADAQDLALMIRRLVTALRKARPMAPHDLDYQALDLLKRKGLEGSILRGKL